MNKRAFLALTSASLAALAITTLPFAYAAAPATPSTATAKLSWGDQGDGTFKNPIIKADYSDPDVIRVGKDFYLIASDFAFVGMQVMHSTDLVNWKIIGQVYNKLTMAPKYDTMQGYGEGTWAPSIRYHNGEFYIFVCTPKDGLYMWHAKNPAGPWSDTVTVWAQSGLEDPCPFWDDDGTAYLVHSHTGAGPLILHKMSADGTKLLDDGKEIFRGNVSEGPKMYKRHGYYYICLPEGGVDRGGQTMLRSKDIYGPYEKKVVLENGSPHQGGLVELDSGEAWFIAFKSAGWLGRVANLEPVKWGDDDWPTFGEDGKHVVQANMPNVGPSPKPGTPQPIDGALRQIFGAGITDEFNSKTLDPIWQWNHNPINENWSLTENPGYLRLKAAPATGLAQARNTLTQKLWDDYGLINVKLSTAKMADGQNAGITFESGNQFGYIGVSQQDGKRHVVTASVGPVGFRGGPGGPGSPGGVPPTSAPAFAGPEVSDVIYLRATYEQGSNGQTAMGHYFYSLDGKKFEPVPGVTTLSFVQWKGARIGLFSYGPNPGAADFGSFTYKYFSAKDALTAALAP